MDRQPMLVAVAGPLQGARFPVDADGLTLGREEACSVVIPDPDVSRFHARLVFHNAAIWVQDAGSRNGVFVNEKRVVRHKQLSPGDELAIGEHRFTLELDPLPISETSITGAVMNLGVGSDRPKWMPWVGAAVVAVVIGLILTMVGCAW